MILSEMIFLKILCEMKFSEMIMSEMKLSEMILSEMKFAQILFSKTKGTQSRYTYLSFFAYRFWTGKTRIYR